MKCCLRIALKCPELSCIAFLRIGRVIFTMLLDFGSEMLIKSDHFAYKISIQAISEPLLLF